MLEEIFRVTMHTVANGHPLNKTEQMLREYEECNQNTTSQTLAIRIKDTNIEKSILLKFAVKIINDPNSGFRLEFVPVFATIESGENNFHIEAKNIEFECEPEMEMNHRCFFAHYEQNILSIHYNAI